MAGTAHAWNQAKFTQQAIYRLQTREGVTTGAGLPFGSDRVLICTRSIAETALADSGITNHKISRQLFSASRFPEAYKIGWPSGRLRNQDTREEESTPHR